MSSTVTPIIPHCGAICPPAPSSYFYLPLLPVPQPVRQLAAPRPVLALAARNPRRADERRAEKDLYRHILSWAARPNGQVMREWQGWTIGPCYQHVTVVCEPLGVRFSDGKFFPVALSATELTALLDQARQAYYDHQLRDFRRDLSTELQQITGLVTTRHRFKETTLLVGTAEGDWQPVMTVLGWAGELDFRAYLDPALVLLHRSPAWAKRYYTQVNYEALHDLVDEEVARHNARLAPDGDAAVTNWPEAQRFETAVRARLAGLGRVIEHCRYGDYSLIHHPAPEEGSLFIQEQGERVMLSAFVPHHQRLYRQAGWAEYYAFRARAPFWMKNLLKRLVEEHNAALVAVPV